MYTHQNISADSWDDTQYALLDSGDNRKLERYGNFIVSRPDTQSIWLPHDASLWEKADAEFRWANGKSEWQEKRTLPESWELRWKDTRFIVRLTSFKHTGIFPEQAANWSWMQDCIHACTKHHGATEEKPKMLNLFGYTGIASVVAAQAGAVVTHVDASKQSLTWARENAELSGITVGIRYILDDALKFAKREIRRGAKYEGIILDPPAFGRGPKGETWKIEEQLPELLDAVRELLSDAPGSFFLLNGYAAGYTATSFLQLTESYFHTDKTKKGQYGELHIAEHGTNRVIPAGIYVRFARA